MEHFSNSYIKGFVETCYKAGLHEKQAAALLQAVSEEKEANMEKSAGGGIAKIVKGLMQLGSVAGNIAAGTALGGYNTAKGALSGGSSVAKHYGRLWKNPYRGLFWTTAGLGGLGYGYNELVNSDTDLGGILPVLGSGTSSGGGSYDSGPGYSSSSSTDYVADFYNNPYKTPGIASSRGEQILNGSGSSSKGSGESKLPNALGDQTTLNERARLQGELKEVEDAIAAEKRNLGKYTTATLRGRDKTGSPELLKRKAQLEKALEDNAVRGRQDNVRFNTRRAERIAEAEKHYKELVNNDRVQAKYFSDPADDGSVKSWIRRNVVNPGAELVGLRQTNDEAIQAAERMQEAKQEIERRKAVKERPTSL